MKAKLFNNNARMKMAETGWALPGSVSGQQRGGWLSTNMALSNSPPTYGLVGRVTERAR